MSTIDSAAHTDRSAEVDPFFQALRVSLRPLDYKTDSGRLLGHYSIVGLTSAAAFSANAVLAALRWADPDKLCVIRQIRAFFYVATAITAQRLDPLTLSVARGYTVRDATNATTVSLAASSSQKLRSTMGTSLLQNSNGGNIDVASAAAGLSDGTKVVDSSPIGFMALSDGASIAGLGTGKSGIVYDSKDAGAHPIVLQQNEGILLSHGATAVATGTAIAGIAIDWAEVDGF